MVEIGYISPLKIPKGRELLPQRQRRHDHGFPQSLTLDEALKYLEDELQALNATRIVIYSNIDRLNSPRNRAKRDEDTTICCEIRSGTRTYYLLCDRWFTIECNLYALHLSIRAMRNIVKWGVADLETLMAGFDAASSAAPTDHPLKASGDNIEPEWMHLLGLGATATLEDANAVYRQRAKLAGNDSQQLMELNQAIETARKFFTG